MSAGVDLDDPTLYSRLDSQNMGSLLRDFPKLFAEGWRQAGAFDPKLDGRRIKKIVFLGMGGSAVAGEMAAGLLRLEEGAPATVLHHDYGIPPGVDRETLVIVSSYSGNTEETLSGVELALETGAMLVGITTGGLVAEVAEKKGFPWFPITLKSPPRCALPYSLPALLGVLWKLGVGRNREKDVREAVQALQGLADGIVPETPTAGNAAKKLAVDMRGRIPVIYGGGLTAPVARRWKTQVNENAKAWAFSEELPEAHHNAILGVEQPAELRERLFLVLLDSPAIHLRTRLRFQITTDILGERKVLTHTWTGSGSGHLAQMACATLLGDYASYYLALIYGRDPTPVETIDRIKARLARE